MTRHEHERQIRPEPGDRQHDPRELLARDAGGHSCVARKQEERTQGSCDQHGGHPKAVLEHVVAMQQEKLVIRRQVVGDRGKPHFCGHVMGGKVRGDQQQRCQPPGDVGAQIAE